jgi:UDP-MurNAc hydroxylase
MEFEILSHACLRVTHGAVTLLVDPWLVGSCYWRSWWNYPPIDADKGRALHADFVYLTHIHWDHFHGPSLRALGKDVQLLCPEDRYPRMYRDLRAMGFKNVREIPHAKPFRLTDDFQVTPFSFFPLTDSALVIRAGNTVLLDVNDCKICGLPLKQLKRLYPQIDFVLRSHSSANARVCHQYLDDSAEGYDLVDNKDDYLRSFCNFMSAIKPRYAVPFASNHCHLHKDTRRFNRWQQTPDDVRNYFAAYRIRNNLATQLVTMLPGSVWNEATGFSLAPEGEWFSDREARIEQYAKANQDALEEAYARERKVTVSHEELRDFFARLRSHMPWFWRRRFRGQLVYINSLSDERSTLWKIDLYENRVSPATAEEYRASDMRLEIPAIVLKQSLRMNMFGHAGISKRVRWVATRASMRQLSLFMLMLDLEEYEVIPLYRNLSWRSIRVWLRRWREVLGYVQLLWIMRRRRIGGKEVEQVALQELS